MNRQGVALTVAAISAGAAAIYALLPVLTRRRAEQGTVSNGVWMARLLVLTTMALVNLLMAAIGLGLMSVLSGREVATAIMGFIALLMLAAGLWLGKAEPNPLVGIRTYWSLRSRLAWDKSNRLFGRIAFWCGLGGLAAAPFAPEPAGAQALGGSLVLAMAASVFESWRVWRNDPDRQTI
jgi:uncharacterized membrane protein